MTEFADWADRATLGATLGLLAASLTTLCWIPQAWRTLRSSDTAAISLVFQIVFALGLVCWIAYGWAIDSLPVMVSNTVTLGPVLLILAAKLRSGSRPALVSTSPPSDGPGERTTP